MEVGHDGLGMVSLQKVWITSEPKVSLKDLLYCCFSDFVEYDLRSWAVSQRLILWLNMTVHEQPAIVLLNKIKA